MKEKDSNNMCRLIDEMSDLNFIYNGLIGTMARALTSEEPITYYEYCGMELLQRHLLEISEVIRDDANNLLEASKIEDV